MADQQGRGHRRSSSSASYGGTSNNVHQDKDSHCWTSLRAIFGLMLPCCAEPSNGETSKANNMVGIGSSQGPPPLTSSVVTGTIFGQRKRKVNFCVQEDPAKPPFLLLEFAIPTHLLVKEMQSGLLRITLECDKKNSIAVNDPLYTDDPHSMPPVPLFSEPVWSMYCNGRKVGFAMKKTAKSDSDPAMSNLMTLMQSVTSGAGVIPYRSNSSKHNLTGTLIKSQDGGTFVSNKDGGTPASSSNGDTREPGCDADSVATNKLVDIDGGKQENGGVNSLYNKHDASGGLTLVQDELTSGLSVEKPSLEEDELIYMRANYERVVGSLDSEAFHMINPDGSQCQELSIFLTRS